jgi:hypothetical protein
LLMQSGSGSPTNERGSDLKDDAVYLSFHDINLCVIFCVNLKAFVAVD